MNSLIKEKISVIKSLIGVDGAQLIHFVRKKREMTQWTVPFILTCEEGEAESLS